MSEDRGSHATDPTLTPSQAIGDAPTSASLTPAPHEPAIGALPVRYTLGAQLGAGGMGEVLLATDKQIERDVAIKRMRVAPTPAAIARFVREAKIQGRLDHPAIVPVHELATDADGRPFFVMKRLAGTTLADIIEGNTLPRAKLLRAFADVCLAIEFAHSRSIIHRDLKPANIMLGDYGEVYVLDWGIARMLGERDFRDTTHEPAGGATEAGAILGTPGYIAPELLRGESTDTRADVYALGCILYEILAAAPLLPRGRAALDAALEPVDARPSQRPNACDIPPELDELCVAATARDRDQRPTARELAIRVERYLDGDRDLALRKSVAAAHTEAARAALAAGDGETERATAMREAGRAIAIDPHANDAAELVARLMLQPPREVPREVEARVATIESETGREKIQMIARIELSLLLFIPAVLLLGLRSWQALAVFGVALVVNASTTLRPLLGGRAPTRRDIYVSAVAYALFVAVVGRLFSPFFIAPAIACTSVTMFAMDPRAPWRPLALLYIGAVLAPWLLELAGVLPPTMTALGGMLVMRSDLVIATPDTQFGLAIFAAALIGIGAYMAARLASAHRRAVRTLELQAWHLRQLVS